MANSYLTRTPSSAGNRRKFTFSAWLKLSQSASTTYIFQAGDNGNNDIQFSFQNDNKFYIKSFSGGSTGFDLATYAKYRDSSGWYHFVVAIDTEQSTASNRAKIYVNGELITALVDTVYCSQNTDLEISNTVSHNIGASVNNSQTFDGYMSHVAFVDGQALAPTVFGQTDSSSGIWKFKAPTGVTWGTNGFHLKFENSGNLGLDSSGNSNTFTVNGNGRQSLDTPSNVHATLNPLHRGTKLNEATFSNGNTTHEGTTSGGSYPYTFSTLAPSKGKWYAEFKNSPSGDCIIGIGAGIPDGFLGNSSSAYSVGYFRTGQYYTNGSGNNYGSALSNNDIVGVAMDLDNNKLYFSINGTWQNSGVPTSGSTGTGAISITGTASNTTGVYHFACGKAGSDPTDLQANFGNGYFGTTAISSAGSNGNGSLFEYDVPSGYYALNTKNINTYG
jgi:hypothetical protein